MDKKMNANKIEAVLNRQKRSLTADKLFALVVAIGLLVAILGLRSASSDMRQATGAVDTTLLSSTPADSLLGECSPRSAFLC